MQHGLILMVSLAVMLAISPPIWQQTNSYVIDWFAQIYPSEYLTLFNQFYLFFCHLAVFAVCKLFLQLMVMQLVLSRKFRLSVLTLSAFAACVGWYYIGGKNL